MDCPRCRLSLQKQIYEHQELHFCDTCWGFWVEADKLQAIIQNDTYKFSQQERKTVFDVLGRATPGLVDPGDGHIDCPSCGTKMAKAPFQDGCPIVVDRCNEHGYWLDSGEIKQIQVFFEGQA